MVVGRNQATPGDLNERPGEITLSLQRCLSQFINIRWEPSLILEQT
jgi:hypothetical protein